MRLLKFAQTYKEEISIAKIFLVWRFGLLVVSFLASKILAFKFSFPYAGSLLISTKLPDWIWGWGNFDGVHYLTLANHGYDGFGTQVFFPLYPMLGHLFNNFWSLLLVSNLSIFLAAILFFKLVKKKFGGITAWWCVIFLFFLN